MRARCGAAEPDQAGDAAQRGNVSRGEDVTVGGLLMAEYEQIKSEQRSRIGFRDNLLYATLASMAAVITAVLRKDGQTELLLLLPPVSVLLGWTYLVNDEKISAIGRYVRDELTPKLAALPVGAAKQQSGFAPSAGKWLIAVTAAGWHASICNSPST